MKILITGGAGFIGSHTVEHFVASGHEVKIFDDLSSGKVSNLSQVVDDTELIQADIRDFDALRTACMGIDVVLHLAAISSVERSINEPLTTHGVNSTGCLNVIEAARQSGAGRIVFASSAAIYGDHPELPKKESSPVQPISLYGWQKLTGEFYGRARAGSSGSGPEFLALRYFNVYGPRQDPSSPYSGVISIFAERSLRNQPLLVTGDGLQTRDFIHVSDVAMVNLLAAEAASPLPDVINVATGKETSIANLAGIIVEASSSKAQISNAPPRKADIHRSYADISVLNRCLNYSPQVEIRDGLASLLYKVKTP